MKINCLLALALSASSLAAQDAVIRVDAGKVENKITPYLVNMEAEPITSMDMRSVCLLMESACC